MDKKIFYLLTSVLLIILFTLSLIVFIIQKKKNNQPPPIEPTISIQPTPTKIEIKITPLVTIAPTFTGVFEEELPEAERKLVEQKQMLKGKLPVNENGFTITFDYGEDKFIVETNEPKDQTKINFENWLKNNYPAIPIDRFIIK